MNEQRLYAVTIGRLSDGSRVVEVMKFNTENEAVQFADDINSYHTGLFCGVHYKEDMERYIHQFTQVNS